jgi:3-isopropylmalate/(R)-2-methylmalate dehydratase small subunit
LKPVKLIRSRTVVMPMTDIDTDQIIPARFLTTTTRTGLAARLFADWRYDAAGKPRDDFVLNRPEAQGARILVAGRNFGCGSSREHAPWALLDFGFQAVIATGIADIFHSNALKNGLVPVVIDEATAAWLLENPGAEVTIDLERARVELPSGTGVSFPIDAFARYRLLHGVEELAYLLEQESAIAAHEERMRAAPR